MNQDIAAQHIVRAMRSQFAQNADGQVRRNLITGDAIPLRRLVEIDQQAYNGLSLNRWIKKQRQNKETPVVPHTRQPFTKNQEQAVDLARYKSHPVSSFRVREIIAGSLKHGAVTRLINHAIRMGSLFQMLLSGNYEMAKHEVYKNETVARVAEYECSIILGAAAGFLNTMGYRLHVEYDHGDIDHIDVVPIQNYNQLGQLRASSFHNNLDLSFYLVPIGMRGTVWETGDDPDRKQGVIVLASGY